MISSKYHLPNYSNTNKGDYDENITGFKWETDVIDINWSVYGIFFKCLFGYDFLYIGHILSYLPLFPNMLFESSFIFVHYCFVCLF